MSKSRKIATNTDMAFELEAFDLLRKVQRRFKQHLIEAARYAAESSGNSAVRPEHVRLAAQRMVNLPHDQRNILLD